jgi:hypothetical protein
MRDQIRLRYEDGSVEVFAADCLGQYLQDSDADRVARALVGYSAGFEIGARMSDRQGKLIQRIGLVMPAMPGPVKGGHRAG